MQLKDPDEWKNWHDPIWIAEYGLNAFTVFDYFRGSIFYDKKCNNELLIAQHRVCDPALMRTLTGIEYEVESLADNYFIVRQQERVSPTQAKLVRLFGVFNGAVYVLPTVHALVSADLLTAVTYLQESFKELQGLVTFDPLQGYRFVEDDAAKAAKKQEQKVDEKKIKFSRSMVESLAELHQLSLVSDNNSNNNNKP